LVLFACLAAVRCYGGLEWVLLCRCGFSFSNSKTFQSFHAAITCLSYSATSGEGRAAFLAEDEACSFVVLFWFGICLCNALYCAHVVRWAASPKVFEEAFPIFLNYLGKKKMKQFLSMAHPPLLKVLLWGLLVFLQFHDQHSAAATCFHEERISLLELKAFLESNIIHADNYRLLPSWIDDANSECCGWERVTCNSTTAHVIELSLDNVNQDPYYYEYREDYHYYYFYGYQYYKYAEKSNWLLNVSMLVPLKELRSLNLSSNAIAGCLPNEGMFSPGPRSAFLSHTESLFKKKKKNLK
jgi:hypothetical protein